MDWSALAGGVIGASFPVLLVFETLALHAALTRPSQDG